MSLDKTHSESFTRLEQKQMLQDLQPCEMYFVDPYLYVFDALSGHVLRYKYVDHLELDNQLDLSAYGGMTPNCGYFADLHLGWAITDQGTMVLFGLDFTVVLACNAPSKNIYLFSCHETIYAIDFKHDRRVYILKDNKFVLISVDSPSSPLPLDTFLPVSNDTSGHIFTLQSKVVYQLVGKRFLYCGVFVKMIGPLYSLFYHDDLAYAQGPSTCYVCKGYDIINLLLFPGADCISQSCLINSDICIRSYPNKFLALYSFGEN